MDSARYAECLKSVLARHAGLNPSHGKIETFAVFDDDRKVYCIVDAGWDEGKRVHGLMFVGRIAGGKIILEYDGLHHGITSQLLQAGIPQEDIVHAWKEPCPPEAARPRKKRGKADAPAPAAT